MASVTVQPSIPTALGDGGGRARSVACARRWHGWLRRLPVLPALVYVILVTQLPFLLTIFYSLQNWNLLSVAPARFIGLQNYLDVLNDATIRIAIWNTIVLTVCAVAISVALGIGIAVLLNREIFGKGILRTLMIGPFLVMPTAAALMWKDTLLNPLTGFVNYLLTPIGLGTFDFINRFPMASIVGIEVWRWTPFMMLIVLAGLQSQNQEVLEAARVDGARALQMFRYITLPFIRPFIELGALLGSLFIVQSFDPTLTALQEVLPRDFPPYLINSASATIGSTLLVLLLGLPAAYALSIRPVKRTRDVLFFLISTRFLPFAASLVPLYILARDLHLLDNILVLVIIYTTINLPLGIWLLRSFMLELPHELIEAARVDGASMRHELINIVLPLIMPGIAATSLICLIFSWNEFFYAVNFTTTIAATSPIFLLGLISGRGLFYAKLAAAATLASLPVLLAGWIAQKQLIRGLTMGAVK